MSNEDGEALERLRASVMANVDAMRDAPDEREGDGWEGHIGGACPVEGQGLVDGHGWYFRARGASWSFEVHESPDGYADEKAKPIFETRGEHGPWPEVGWMKNSVAWGHIEASIAAFRAR